MSANREWDEVIVVVAIIGMVTHPFICFVTIPVAFFVIGFLIYVVQTIWAFCKWNYTWMKRLAVKIVSLGKTSKESRPVSILEHNIGL